MAEFEIVLNSEAVKASLGAAIEGYAARIRPGAEIAGKIIQADAKRRCPVSPDGGTLRRSIKSRVLEQDGAVVIQVGSNVHYAIHVEYGHRTRAGTGKSKTNLFRKGQKIKLYVPGQFFLHNAFTAKRQAATAALVASLRQE